MSVPLVTGGKDIKDIKDTKDIEDAEERNTLTSPMHWANVEFIGPGVRHNISVVLHENIVAQILDRIRYLRDCVGSAGGELAASDLYWLPGGNISESDQDDDWVPKLLSQVDEMEVATVCRNAQALTVEYQPYVIPVADYDEDRRRILDYESVPDRIEPLTYTLDPEHNFFEMQRCGTKAFETLGHGRRHRCELRPDTEYTVVALPASFRETFLPACTEVRASLDALLLLQRLIQTKRSLHFDQHDPLHARLRCELELVDSGFSNVSLRLLYEFISSASIQRQLLRLLPDKDWAGILRQFGVLPAAEAEAGAGADAKPPVPVNLYVATITYLFPGLCDDHKVTAFVHFVEPTEEDVEKKQERPPTIRFGARHVAELESKRIFFGANVRSPLIAALLSREKKTLARYETALTRLQRAAASGDWDFDRMNELLGQLSLQRGTAESPAIVDKKSYTAECVRLMAVWSRLSRREKDIQSICFMAQYNDGIDYLFWPCSA